MKNKLAFFVIIYINKEIRDILTADMITPWLRSNKNAWGGRKRPTGFIHYQRLEIANE